MARVLCFDFDDTILLDNGTGALFERFAKGDWRAIQDQYRAGRITVEQQNARIFDLFEGEDAEFREFALSNARIRPGFLELCDWAQWNGWQAAIVSNGFDFAVNAVLDHLGLDRVGRHAGRTRFAYRWRVRYESPRGIELEEGFKLSWANAFRDAGDLVVYFGDGASDIPAAKVAYAVFARDTLLTALEGQRARVFPFETFADAREILEREAEGWAARHAALE